MKITQEELFCIQNDILIDSKEEEEFDYKYKELYETSDRRWTVTTTFVFYLDGKWFMGDYDYIIEDGQVERDIECVEVEPYEVTVTRYKKIKK